MLNIAGCDGAADISFVVDASGSIHMERFPMVLDFIKSVIKELEISPTRGRCVHVISSCWLMLLVMTFTSWLCVLLCCRVAEVTWSNGASFQYGLSQYSTQQDVMQAVGYTKYIGQRTYTADAINMMRTRVYNTPEDRSAAPNYAIIITDGNSNISPGSTIPAAIQVQSQCYLYTFLLCSMQYLLLVEWSKKLTTPRETSQRENALKHLEENYVYHALYCSEF